MRTWAEIYLDALTHNMAYVRSLTDKTILAVVKADGYGHGALTVSRRLQRDGADYFAVATAEEALELRGGGIVKPVLVLGAVDPESIPLLAVQNIRVTVFDIHQAREYSSAAGNSPIGIHIKLDTGMSRLGFHHLEDVIEVCALPSLNPEGLFTHFALADIKNDPFTLEQCRRFEEAISFLSSKGLNFMFVHCENSAGVVNYDKAPGNMARPGILLYGWDPTGRANSALEPVMRWCARIAQVKTISKGDTVSYGRRFTAEKDCSIAVLSCGYADGYHRLLSDRGYVLVNGQKAPIRGNICMDMMMVEVTGIDCHAGDTAVLFGVGGDNALSLDTLAEMAETVSYELLCSVSARVPRIVKNK